MAFKTYDRAMAYKRTHTKEFQQHLEVVSCGPVYRSSNLSGDQGWCRWTVIFHA